MNKPLSRTESEQLLSEILEAAKTGDGFIKWYRNRYLAEESENDDLSEEEIHALKRKLKSLKTVGDFRRWFDQLLPNRTCDDRLIPREKLAELETLLNSTRSFNAYDEWQESLLEGDDPNNYPAIFDDEFSSPLSEKAVDLAEKAARKMLVLFRAGIAYPEHYDGLQHPRFVILEILRAIFRALPPNKRLPFFGFLFEFDEISGSGPDSHIISNRSIGHLHSLLDVLDTQRPEYEKERKFYDILLKNQHAFQGDEELRLKTLLIRAMGWKDEVTIFPPGMIKLAYNRKVTTLDESFEKRGSYHLLVTVDPDDSSRKVLMRKVIGGELIPIALTDKLYDLFFGLADLATIRNGLAYTELRRKVYGDAAGQTKKDAVLKAIERTKKAIGIPDVIKFTSVRSEPRYYINPSIRILYK